MELYTNKLNTNQVFKNYKALCEFLEEPVKTGKSKQLQLKNWERYFSYCKEGNKFIITEIYNTPKRKTHKGNFKNIQPMMDYIMSTFETDYMNHYYAISYWSTTILNLVDKNINDLSYVDDEEIKEFCIDNGISDVKLFKTYLSIVKFVIKKLIVTSLKNLAKRGLIEYNEGYKFRYDNGRKFSKFVSTHKLNDEIDTMEREICQEIMNSEERFKNRKIKGKQLLYYLQQEGNKEYFDLYMSKRQEYINNNEEILEVLNLTICEEDCGGSYIDGTISTVESYFSAYEIVAFDTDYEKISNKQEVFDVIEKLALRQMEYIKSYNVDICGYENPYKNDETKSEICKINNLFFVGVQKKVDILEIAKEECDIDLDEAFNINPDPTDIWSWVS